MTSSETAKRKVEQIISNDGVPATILAEGYERTVGRGMLSDYATHPGSSAIVQERATTAIEQLSPDDEEASDE